MIRVWQFSDTHLYADPAARFHGVSPEQTLTHLLQSAARRPDRPDLVLVTGDLVHDGSAAAYQRLRDHFARLPAPVYCLPGNHDDPAVMRQVLAAGPVTTPGVVSAGGWQIVLLDSTVPDRIGGRLDADELARLESVLATQPERHALICLHHPPLPSGMRWMDETMLLENPEALFAVIDRHTQVRAVIWGHIHQRFSAVRNGVQLLGAPSTMLQFRPGSAEFEIDVRPPGWRRLALYPDGRIETAIEGA